MGPVSRLLEAAFEQRRPGDILVLALGPGKDSPDVLLAAARYLRDLMAHPALTVSKEAAALALGRVLVKTNPAEARKLLEPLRNERAAISQAAVTALGELPPQALNK